ncbi:transport protein particle component [Didymella exigua CBS 183.55]|uniref:Transport protein particle component n=1 Tax=Didymella exigua CBS 183.55 TaxID=1150837 RepID=A0A6A5S0X7_9PLEO|nr:transport protein particle component [Didymella exigua CBS 183.55]KAF1933439.1 transport protein particle component [Didymella exigua CBS 183.55]
MAQPVQAPTDTPTSYIDPTFSLLNSTCLDLLLIELVPMAYRITADLAAREEEWTGTSTTKANRLSSHSNDASSTAAAGGGAGTTGGGGTLTVDEEESREAVFHRLESLGYRVGLGVVERFSRDTPRPTTPLDCIKFLCKDLWTLLFRKQIDNLKTNHRGIYVLTDNTFKPLTRMSFDTKKYTPEVQVRINEAAERMLREGDADGNGINEMGLGREANSIGRVQPFLYFPAGVVRGCLEGLGIRASVQAECSALPSATFQIRTAGAKN